MALRKTLFKSPNGSNNTPSPSESKRSGEMETLLNKIQVEIEVDNNLNIVEKELHDKRLAKMKEELKNLEVDEWMHQKLKNYVAF